ncbi:MAG: YaiO family outer membrane beta-barrel protein [Proteobacteria bacterium]|nr:YaiO family outer membrane beta-barrel protein [Pseudomonadota bacterium]
MVVRSSDCKLSATASAPFILVLLVMTSSAQRNDIAADTADCRPAEHRFLYAREAAHAGDFDRAKQEYVRLVLDEPDNVDYIFGYAQVLFWSDNLERSPRFLERARKLAPDYEDIWKLEYQARISATRNEPSASFDQFRQMAAKNFPSAEWHRVIDKAISRKYRIAYSLDNARLSSEQAVVHALTVNFYANSGSRLGVILAAGDEVEIVGPGQLLKTDVNSIALTGRHPINEHLGFGWRLATHRQGPFYRRNSIGISISGGF